MRIKIVDDIDDELALRLVLSVVKQGRISKNSQGRLIYCHATSFVVDGVEYMVYVRGDNKDDCFVVSRK